MLVLTTLVEMGSLGLLCVLGPSWSWNLHGLFFSTFYFGWKSKDCIYSPLSWFYVVSGDLDLGPQICVTN